MKEDEAIPTTTTTTNSNSNPNSKKEGSDSGLFGRGRYKFWAFAAILLLAFWSMFTGTITLRLSTTGNVNPIGADLGIPVYDNLDVLEMEEREKVVKHMWDVYNTRRIMLPKFWQEAFVAAYEELTSDVPGVRDAAIGEIAKMSVDSVTLDLPSSRSTSMSGARDLRRSFKRLLNKPAASS